MEGNAIHIKINKPLYDNYVNIRTSILYDAIKKGVLLKIEIPQGIAYACPKWWIKTGTPTEKVFKIPNKPMKLVGNYVPLKTKTEDEEMEEFSKFCL